MNEVREHHETSTPFEKERNAVINTAEQEHKQYREDVDTEKYEELEKKEAATERREKLKKLEEKYHFLSLFDSAVDSYRIESYTGSKKREYESLLVGGWQTTLRGELNSKINRIVSSRLSEDGSTDLLADAVIKKGIDDAYRESCAKLKEIANNDSNPEKINLEDLRESASGFSLQHKLNEIISNPNRALVRKEEGENGKFYFEKGGRAEYEEALTAIQEHFISRAKTIVTAGDIPAGSGEAFLLGMESALSNTVGTGHLRLKGFEAYDKDDPDKKMTKVSGGFRDAVWEKLKNDPNVQQVLAKVDDEIATFEEELDDEDLEKKLERRLGKLIKKESMERAKDEARPYGSFLDKYSGLGELALFAGEKLIYITLIINILRHPKDFWKNPVILAEVAALTALTYHYHPKLFAGATEQQKDVKAEFEEKLDDPEAISDNVEKWLGIVSEANLKVGEPLGDLIRKKVQNGDSRIGSQDLVDILCGPGKDQSVPEKAGPIPETDDDARQLFYWLSQAQRYELNPKKIIAKLKPEDD